MDYRKNYQSWLSDPRLSEEGKRELEEIACDEKAKEYRFGGELSVSEADGNEIKWQEAEISHAKKESKGPVMVEAGPDRNERKEAEKENKVNTGEKIADKERADTLRIHLWT